MHSAHGTVIGRAIEDDARRPGHAVVKEFTGRGITSFPSGLVVAHDDDPLHDGLIEVGTTLPERRDGAESLTTP